MDYKEPTQELVTSLIKTFRTYNDTQLVDPDMKAAFDYWQGLFRRYNMAQGKGHVLHMGCRPCYMKVYTWARKQDQNHQNQ